VGGGIIANGTVLNGENGTAGEIGHITVDPNGKQCNCGRKGCLETIASATGIAHQAMAIIEKDPESLLAKRYKQKKTITAKDVFDLAFSGDEVSMRIIDYTCDRSEEHTSELQSRFDLVCRLLLEKKKHNCKV